MAETGTGVGTGGCRPACWTAVPCPECGQGLPPRGRSVPLAMGLSACCEQHRLDDANVRHLWDEHDDCRHYTDPAGWQAHVEACGQCRRGQ